MASVVIGSVLGGTVAGFVLGEEASDSEVPAVVCVGLPPEHAASGMSISSAAARKIIRFIGFINEFPTFHFVCFIIPRTGEAETAARNAGYVPVISTTQTPRQAIRLS